MSVGGVSGNFAMQYQIAVFSQMQQNTKVEAQLALNLIESAQVPADPNSTISVLA